MLENYWQRRISRRRSIALGTAGLSAAYLAACGGSSNNNKPATQAPAAATQAAPATGAGSPAAGGNATAAARPATPNNAAKGSGRTDTTADESAGAIPGGTWRYRTSTDYPALDPFKSASFAAQYHGAYIYSRLSMFKSGPGVDPNSFEVAPDAATSFETPDGLSYIYHLRPNMKFGNVAPVNGRALDASDVKFSYDRFTSVSPNAPALTNLVESFTTPDQMTVQFKLRLKYAPFPGQIASASEPLWLFPKEADGFDPAKLNIGTGPYTLEKDTPSVGDSYTRRADWWQKGLPYDNTQRIIIPEQAQYLAQFIAKKIDEYAPTNEEVIQVKSQAPEALLGTVPIGVGFGMIYFSGQEPDSPFKDPRVRRAVSMALDRDNLIDSFGNVQAIKKAGLPIQTAWHNLPVPAGFSKWWLDPKDPSFKEGQWYRFDLKAAKQLLTAAGYPNGFKSEYHYPPTRYGQTFDSSAEAVLEMMKQLGLDLEVHTDDYNKVYIPEVFTKGNFKGMTYGLETSYSDVDGYCFNMLHPNGTRNHSHVNQQGGTLFQDGGKLTGMIEAQRQETDEQKRKAVLGDIQRYVSDNMIYVPTVSGGYSTFNLAWPWVHNAFAFRSSTYAQAPEAWAHYWVDEKERSAKGG